MKFNFSFILIFIICIFCVNAFNIKHKKLQRFKRSEDEGFLGKAKSSLASFGSQVKKVAVKGYEETKKVAIKGYEETKNLFSSDRSVGDYTLDKIEPRFDEDGNEIRNQEITSTQVDGTNTANRLKREANDQDSEHVADEMMAMISETEHVGATESKEHFFHI
jgi:hypothetical protein